MQRRQLDAAVGEVEGWRGRVVASAGFVLRVGGPSSHSLVEQSSLRKLLQFSIEGIEGSLTLSWLQLPAKGIHLLETHKH